MNVSPHPHLQSSPIWSERMPSPVYAAAPSLSMLDPPQPLPALLPLALPHPTTCNGALVG